MVDEFQFEERFCAFVDILAFRELLHTKTCKQIHNLLSHVHSPFPGTKENQDRTGFRAQSISDAVAVSTSFTELGLRHLFYSLASLQDLFFTAGVYMRGGIARGQLFQNGSMVFGSALVEAYELECKIARYPRIMIAQSVIDTIANYSHAVNFNAKLKHDSDGSYLHFLDTIDQFRGEPIPKHHIQRDVLSRFIIASKTLQRKYDQSAGSETHREKLQWLAKYFSSSINPLCTEMPRIVM